MRLKASGSKRSRDWLAGAGTRGGATLFVAPETRACFVATKLGANTFANLFPRPRLAFQGERSESSGATNAADSQDPPRSIGDAARPSPDRN